MYENGYFLAHIQNRWLAVCGCWLLQVYLFLIPYLQAKDEDYYHKPRWRRRWRHTAPSPVLLYPRMLPGKGALLPDQVLSNLSLPWLGLRHHALWDAFLVHRRIETSLLWTKRQTQLQTWRVALAQSAARRALDLKVMGSSPSAAHQTELVILLGKVLTRYFRQNCTCGSESGERRHCVGCRRNSLKFIPRLNGVLLAGLSSCKPFLITSLGGIQITNFNFLNFIFPSYHIRGVKMQKIIAHGRSYF